MTAPWIVAFATLWAVVLLVAVVVLGVVRRVTNVLEDVEAVARARHAVDISGAPPGTAVPRFHVRTPQGEVISSSELFDADALVLFVGTGCGPCEALLGRLAAADALIEGVRLLVIADESDEAKRLDVPASVPVFYQLERTASRAFQNVGMPQAFLVDRGGSVRARGFTTTKEGLEELVRTAPKERAPLADLGEQLAPGGVT